MTMGTLELIKVEEREGRQVVSARELYLGLGLDKSNWSRWSKQNIEEEQFFKENEDWVGFVTMTNGNETKDYAVSLEFAKHIAMMARTDKSHEYRNYLLQCEKMAKSNVIVMPDFTNPAEAARAWALAYEEKQRLFLEVKDKDAHIGRLVHDIKTYTTSEIAKELGLKSANQLNKILEDKGIQYKLNGTWLLYSRYADMDYTSTKQIVLDNGHVAYDRRWTGIGRDFILSLFNKD